MLSQTGQLGSGLNPEWFGPNTQIPEEQTCVRGRLMTDS